MHPPCTCAHTMCPALRVSSQVVGRRVSKARREIMHAFAISLVALQDRARKLLRSTPPLPLITIDGPGPARR